ncbi:hypothetical protein BS78_05G014800 [Paspalum vaginatum]|nr:hypothetical protein BS78_05G014800 [Paspalum vaginatum]
MNSAHTGCSMFFRRRTPRPTDGLYLGPFIRPTRQDYTGVVAALYSRAALLRARRFRHDRALRAASRPGDALRSRDVRSCPTAIRTARRHTNNLDPILLQTC